MRIKLRTEYPGHMSGCGGYLTYKGEKRWKDQNGTIIYNGPNNTIIEERKVEWVNNQKSTKNLFKSMVDYVRKEFPHGYLFTEEITWGTSGSVLDGLPQSLGKFPRLVEVLKGGTRRHGKYLSQKHLQFRWFEPSKIYCDIKIFPSSDKLFTTQLTVGAWDQVGNNARCEIKKARNPLNGVLRAYKRIQQIIQNREHLTKPNYVMD